MISTASAEEKLQSLVFALRDREKAAFESGLRRLRRDLKELTLATEPPWLVRIFMANTCRRLRKTLDSIGAQCERFDARIAALSTLNGTELEHRYGDAARKEFKESFPDEHSLLERIAIERRRLDQAARWASVRSGQLITPFADREANVIVLSESFNYDGTMFRRADTDVAAGVTPQRYVIYDDDVTGPPALGTLRLEPDGVHTRLERSEMLFSTPSTLPTRTIQDSLQSEFGRLFRDIITRTITTQTYDENHITFSILEALHRETPYRIVTSSGVALVRLRMHKQTAHRETESGDICVIIERSASDLSGVGVCFLEAKRRYIEPPKFKTLSQDQLSIIRSNTDYCALLLYDYTQPGDWICSTVKVNEVLMPAGDLRDIGVALGKSGMPLCDRLVTRYFRLDEMDTREASVKAAARDARRKFRQTLHVQIAIGADDTEAIARLYRIDAELAHLVKFGITSEEHHVQMEMERQIQSKDRGRSRNLSRDHGLGY